MPNITSTKNISLCNSSVRKKLSRFLQLDSSSISKFSNCYSVKTNNSNSSSAIIPHNQKYLINGDFCVEFWLKLLYWSKNYSRIIDKNYQTGFAMIRNGTSKNCVFTVKQSDIMTTDIPNYWTHVAYVRDKNVGKVYFNSNLVGEGIVDDGPLTSTSDIGLFINRSTNYNNEYCSGGISNIRIWDAARSKRQINDNYNVPILNKQTHLICNYPLINGSLNDVSENNDSIELDVDSEIFIDKDLELNLK